MLCLGCRSHSSAVGKTLRSAGGLMDISFPLIERLSRELPALAVSEISLIGEGEPLLHPRLLDIIGAFKKTGCTIQLFTNGTLIDQAKALALLDSGLDTLKITLWANSLDEYQKCHPGVNPHYFFRTLKAVEMLIEQKARSRTSTTIVLNQPLNRFNCASILARVHLAHELGCDAVTFSIFRDWKGEFASLALSAEETGDVCRRLRVAQKNLAAFSIAHNIDEVLLRYELGEYAWFRLPCYIGWLHARIKTDGTVLHCNSCNISMGNLNESSFEKIWNGPNYRRFRKLRSSYDGGKFYRDYCYCGWCCFAKQNARVHQVFKWVRW